MATTDADIERCSSVLRELRPHVTREDFLERIRRQERGGYALAFLEDAGVVKAVAGFRVSECLA